MTAAPAQISGSRVPAAIERYFQVSLFLLLTAGFLSLATTGKLDLPSVAFVTVSLGVRAILLLRGREVSVPERWTSLLSLAYVAVYAVDYFFISRTFVDSTVHLVLFGMVVKIFSVHRERDLLYLSVLALLMVLAASVLTVDTIFLGIFAVFVMLAISTFVSFEMRRSARAAQLVQQPQAGRNGETRPSLSHSLSLVSLILMLSILIGGVGIFFILPRISGGYLGGYARRDDILSGFRDSIQLGQIGRIQQSNQVVMHAEIEGDSRSFDMRWRGAVLSTFTGRGWSNAHPGTVQANRSGNFDLSPDVLAENPYLLELERAGGVRTLIFRVAMEPTASGALFLPGRTKQLTANFVQIVSEPGQSYLNMDPAHPVSRYEGVAILSTPEPQRLRSSDADTSDIPDGYLELPPLDPRISHLATTITAESRSGYDKAQAVESYLQRNFSYTLDLPDTEPADPVADFLFRRRQGHCEYFATAMAVLLREVGIPSRVVTGFHGGEYNDLTGSYIIRARDAHAWVEAYFPGQGWVTFDPTPASSATGSSTWSRMSLYVDAFRVFWQEWVVNYDRGRQESLAAGITTTSIQRATSLRVRLQELYDRLLERARRFRRQAEQHPAAASGWSLAGFLLLVFALGALPGYKAWRSLRIARAPGRAPEMAASIWYRRMTSHLERYGWPKRASQTPTEYAVTVDHPELRDLVREFTQCYEGARFGHSAASAERLPGLYARVREHRVRPAKTSAQRERKGKPVPEPMVK